jgi:Domain of unknown function (DUF4424)
MAFSHRTASKAWAATTGAVLALTSLVSPLRAAEPTTELPAGGLTYGGQQTLVTRQEDVVLAAERVRATYTIQNAAPEARSHLMAFALPDLDMMALDGSTIDNPAYDPANPMNYVGFSAIIDGQPAETYVEIRALALGLIDASVKLRELGLPLYPLHVDMAARLQALPEAARKDLLERGLIRVADGQIEPMWTLKTTLFWQQPFAAGQSHKVEIAYRPISGSSVWSSETSAMLQQRFCVAAATVDDLLKRAATRPATVRWVHFLAGTGAIARGPSIAYRLAIETASAKQSAHTCRQGLVSATQSSSREITQTDLVAEDEIQVLFVE